MLSVIADEDTMVLCQKGTLTSFYHGEISRAESERRLKAFSQTSKTQDGGLYLVRRKSDCKAAAYVLSFMGYGCTISHFIIYKTPDNRLCMGGLFFNRLCELVTYYSSPGANLLKNEWLVYPVPTHDDGKKPLDKLAQLHQIRGVSGQDHHYEEQIKRVRSTAV